MSQPRVHRKRLRRFHEHGDFHELTFSCFGRRPLLTNDPWRRILAERISVACRRWDMPLHGFVFMPEHVHLLVSAADTAPRIDNLLKSVKRMTSVRIKSILAVSGSPLLETLTVRERPGVTAFRFWQEGGGYDRNLQTAAAVMASLEYIHQNPVARGLCQLATDWKWSSACYFAGDGVLDDRDLPLLTPLPAEIFD